MTCKRCGCQVPEGVTYCGSCGKKVESKNRLLPVLAAVAVIGLGIWAGAALFGGGDQEPTLMHPTETTVATEVTEAPAVEVTEAPAVEVTEAPELPGGGEVPAIEFTQDDAVPIRNESSSTPAREEPTPQERLPGVPEKWAAHVLLKDRGIASCEYLRGDVTVTVIFAEDPAFPWTEEDLQTAKDTLDLEAGILEAEAAAYGVELNIDWNYIRMAYGEPYSQEDWFAWVEPALESNQLPHWGSINVRMEEQLGVQAAPVIFCFNQDGRAFATGNKEVDASETVVLYRDLTAFRHELCHLFGAVDYYYPDIVADISAEYFPESLMHSGGDSVDSFTAYLLGWTDELSDEAVYLLEQTEHFTLEEYYEVMRNQTITGYVTTEFSFGTYEGELKLGLMHGWGTLTWDNGVVYTGQWENGIMQGRGTMTWTDGASFEGDWVNGKRTGYGVMTWSDGTRYEGQWENDKRTGQGVLTFPSGTVQSGQFKDDEFIG